VYLALSTQMWPDRSLAEALQAASETGVRALDLAATPDVPHVRPLAGREGAEALKPLLQGWKVVALTADHPDLARAEEEGGAEAVEWTIGAMRCAGILGARVVSTSLGRTDIDAWETAWNRAVTALRQVLHETRRTGVRLAVEIHLDDVLDSLRKARRLLEAIPDPRLGLTLDTAYLQHLRIQFRDALEVAGDRLYMVHLRDAAPGDPFRNLGEGRVSFPATFRALREHGYDGPLSLELLRLPPGEALPPALARLREWLDGEPGGPPANADPE
ncbi:MAG TPA: sugar phosphate isomerase/epimerase, partial [Armatimonadota bacterium]|nr:sugar phosphate isomerase/epimerase [Armatimonadota bacterium]